MTSALLGVLLAVGLGAVDVIFVPFDRARLLEGRLPSALAAPEILLFALLMLVVSQAVLCGLEDPPGEPPSVHRAERRLVAFAGGASCGFTAVYFVPGLAARSLGAGLTLAVWALLVVTGAVALAILALSTYALARVVRERLPRPFRARAALGLVVAMVLFSGRVQPVHEMGWTALGATFDPLRYALESLTISWDYAVTGLIPYLACHASKDACSANDLSGTFSGGACLRTSLTGQRKAVPSLSTLLQDHGRDGLVHLARAAGVEVPADVGDLVDSNALSDRMLEAERRATYCFSPGLAGPISNPWWWTRRDPLWDALVALDPRLSLYRGTRYAITTAIASLLLLASRIARRVSIRRNRHPLGIEERKSP